MSHVGPKSSHQTLTTSALDPSTLVRFGRDAGGPRSSRSCPSPPSPTEHARVASSCLSPRVTEHAELPELPESPESPNSQSSPDLPDLPDLPEMSQNCRNRSDPPEFPSPPATADRRAGRFGRRLEVTRDRRIVVAVGLELLHGFVGLEPVEEAGAVGSREGIVSSAPQPLRNSLLVGCCMSHGPHQVKGTTNDNQKDERCGDQEARPLEEWTLLREDWEPRSFCCTSPAGPHRSSAVGARAVLGGPAGGGPAGGGPAGGVPCAGGPAAVALPSMA